MRSSSTLARVRAVLFALFSLLLLLAPPKPAAAQTGWTLDFIHFQTQQSSQRNFTLHLNPPSSNSMIYYSDLYGCYDCGYCFNAPLYVYILSKVHYETEGTWSCTHEKHEHHQGEIDNHIITWEMWGVPIYVDNGWVESGKISNNCCCYRTGAMRAVAEVYRGQNNIPDCACGHWETLDPLIFPVFSDWKMLVTTPGVPGVLTHKKYQVMSFNYPFSAGGDDFP
jgi:hypothetical protein